MSTKKCPFCAEEIQAEAIKCRFCRTDLDHNAVKRKPQKKWYEKTSVTLCVAALLIVIGFGFIHIITGSDITSSDVPIRLALKGSFGYSETFINVDKITGMPWIAAKSKYPIGCKILQKMGYIESDETFQKRVQDKVEEKIEKAQKEFQRELQKLQDQ